MTYKIDRVDVWAGAIVDKPGGLAAKLDALAAAGASLEFVIARRAAEKPGKGVVFVAPIKGAKQSAAARKAGLSKKSNLHSLRLEGADKGGLGACVAAALADAGVNLRGFSGAALGRKAVLYFAFDSSADAVKARRVLKKALKI
jgi:hypothetical protein